MTRKMSLGAIFFLSLLSIKVYAKVFLFIHGGPGFSSEAERNILKPYLENLGHRVYFWDEPSTLRPQGFPFEPANAFANTLKSSELFLTQVCAEEILFENKCQLEMIAHSFGAHVAVNLAQKNPEVFTKMILFSPSLNIENSEKNILEMAARGLREENKEDLAVQLEALLPQLVEAFNETKANAFLLATNYQNLFFNYWADLTVMGNYFSYLVGEYQFDAVSFFGVRSTQPLVEKNPAQRIAIKTDVYFGADDPVVNAEKETIYLNNYFSNMRIYTVKNSKHYSHIEKKEVVSW